MARFYSEEDEDFPGQAELWQANCERSLKGKKGQASLRDLEAALLALPSPRLIAGELQNKAGEVCAIGALAKFKGHECPIVAYGLDEFGDTEIDPIDVESATIDLAKTLGVPRMVAIAVAAENDAAWVKLDSEQRYQRVLAWVRQEIQPTATDA